MNPKLLVATEIENIPGLRAKLETQYNIIYFPHFKFADVDKVDPHISAIFTNPNNSRVYFDESVLNYFEYLKIFATASTGTIHIDTEYLKETGIKLVSITKSISVLEKITSTAEHAFLMTLAALRHYDAAVLSVREGTWDYSPFVGRQMNALKIGVIGYGRLGKMYARFCRAFDAQVVCCDPFKQQEILTDGYEAECIEHIFSTCDVVSLHIHAIPENIGLINEKLLADSKPNQVLVNTSRGEIVDDASILGKAQTFKGFRYYTDVLSNEHRGLFDNRLYKSELFNSQIFATPHCGGMTSDARAIAFHHAADLLLNAGADG